MMKKVVIALGGNAITREFEEGNIYQQFANTRRALIPVVNLVQKGYKIALTHGNGPQVGNMLIRVEASRESVPPIPLGVIVADLQGGMGYMIQQTLQNKLLTRNLKKRVISIVTQVLVDKNDPSIQNPTKFVGPAYDENQVDELVNVRGWIMKEDVGRGWRRVVPSPVPLNIVEKDIVCDLIENGYIVITCGGGGIPVYREEDGSLEGIDTVIDKDLASAVLAKTIGADAFYILTRVDQVAINYAKPNQEKILKMNVVQAENWLAEGQFPAGSMGPKIQAAVNFLKAGGKECIITSIEKFSKALEGMNGTRITLD